MTDQIQELFERACDLPSHERTAYLDSAVGRDSETRKEIESLLAAHDGAGQFLGEPTADFVDPDSAPLCVETGDVIDRYKILERIGEGGFGVVYMAQQLTPVKRKVALKIIKLGMDTKQVVARFEAERQALAMMDHQNIASVLDGGATDTGRPYFVMELVRGDPITNFCDQRKLTTKERLRLFLQVCEAVQHAHQKGIIHRDIKPSNVLVTVANDKPVAKVIDFGIAKATNSELTEKTLFTQFRQLIGTPEYMSPEQAERSGVDVDTRSDIYSMGVLLYEILTGTTPFCAKRLRSAAWGTLQDIIRDEDPPIPSTRVSTLKDELSGIEKRRSISDGKLRHVLRGELDWIVMKAMAKDRTSRYPTPAAFGEDVERFLEDQPVLAGPISTSYRLKKFFVRHKAMFSAACLALATLLIGLVAALYMMFWALAERDRAVAAEKLYRQQAERADRFSELAGNAFIDPSREKESKLDWQSEIAELRERLPASSAERIRKECNYVSWLCNHALFNNLPAYWDEADKLFADLYPRIDRYLETDDPHFFAATNAFLQLRVIHQKVKPEEVVDTYDRLLESAKLIHGLNSEMYHELQLEFVGLLLRCRQIDRATEQLAIYHAYEGEKKYRMSHRYRLQIVRAAIEGTEFDGEMPKVFQDVIREHEEHVSDPGTFDIWKSDEDEKGSTE